MRHYRAVEVGRVATGPARAIVQLTVLNQTLSCGSCSACCTTMAVSEIKKPMYESCTHVAAVGGCTIYADRPPSCREWACGWAQGLLGQSDSGRPDNSGVILNIEHPGVMVIYEVTPGSVPANLGWLLSKLRSREHFDLIILVSVERPDERWLAHNEVKWKPPERRPNLNWWTSVEEE